MQTQRIATSIAANRHMEDSGKKLTHADIILQGMRRMYKMEGTYQEIAKYCDLTEQQVWKRLGEMAKANTIKKTGRTKILGSGHRGEIWEVANKLVQVNQQDLFAA